VLGIEDVLTEGKGDNTALIPLCVDLVAALLGTKLAHSF
jgi:hypothetical protein